MNFTFQQLCKDASDHHSSFTIFDQHSMNYQMVQVNFQLIVRRICAFINTIALKIVKVSKLIQRKLIPYKSIKALGAFQLSILEIF